MTSPVLIGAAVASGVALVLLIRRSRRQRQAPDYSSGVVGTILKGALFAAVSTVPRVALLRLAQKALHRGGAGQRPEVAAQTV
jgi:hypothetical protein